MLETAPSKQKGILAAIQNLHERRQALGERNRAQKEAKKLAEILLTVPRRRGSVLHEARVGLADGRQISINLCNTANARSVEELIAAQHGADRIDISVSGSREPKRDTSMTFHFARNHEIDYREYYAGGTVQYLCVFQTEIVEGGYYASRNKTQVPFDAKLQHHVYKQMADLFQEAHKALFGLKVPQATS